MKKILVILPFLFLFTACSSISNNNNGGELSEINKTEETNIEDVEASNIKDIDITLDNTYEKILKEYTSSEGNRIIEYEDGYKTTLSPEGTIGIVKKPMADDYTKYFGSKLEELPVKDGTEFVHDLRSKDVSNIDLFNELDYLLVSDFDDDTKWPDSLPKEYDLKKIRSYGMDPGLGIRDLHEKGITGEGVGIAIIDQPLLVDHIEYKDRVKLYEEIHENSDFALMHGAAVASIAVGKNVGVAPEADLYYIAESHGVFKDGSFDWDLYWLEKSIDRIIEVNRTLPKDKKIRVISISLGIGTQLENGDLAEEAIRRAYDEGIYTIHVGNDIMGVGRNPLGNPNDLDSYTKGYFWRNSENYEWIRNDILIPMDARYVASPIGEDKYVFYYSGGMSWSVPYAAGVYALCCQVNPDMTIEEFELAINKTAIKIHLDDSNREYKILNPEGLINEIRK